MRVGNCLWLAFLFLVVAISALPAQDPPPPAEPGPEAVEFQRVFGQWKDMLAELGVLQGKYREADEQQRADIRKQWDQLIEKGDAMQIQLIDAAEKAFAEAPNADKKVTDLLVDVLIGHVQSRRVQLQTDNYEEALRLGRLLMDNDCRDKRVYNAAGIAAFAAGDFDAAEKYLKLAKQNKVQIGVGSEPMDGLVKDFLSNPDRHKKAWAEEQKIREAEAKAAGPDRVLPRVLLKTSKGDIELQLFENQAPNTVANFISLVEKGYYNGLTFHRVMPGFMAQGGCPKGTGTGGPGYHIPCECYQQDYRRHFRGSLSMAHAGRDTGGSQFFLTFLPTSHLDGRHTVFGRVIKGIDVLSKLQRRDPSRPNQPRPDKIIEAKVLEKRNHEYVPKTLPLEKPKEKPAEK